MAYNKLFESNSKDNVREDSNLLQVKNEQDFEDQDSSLNMNDSLNNYYSESPTMFRLSRSFDGAYDDFSMEKQQKPKEDKRKRDIEKKTSEAFQPIIPKPKKLGDTGSKGRGRRMTFKAKTSNVRKPRTKLFKIPCKHCDPSNSSNKNGSPCIKHYFCNLSKKSNVTAVNDLLKSQEQGTNHEEIEADTNKVNEGIFQDINEGTVLSVGAKDKDQMKDRELTNNLRSEVQNSTVDDVRVSNQGENVEEIAKPIDQNSVESNGISKTRYKRKSIPIKRSLKETPQKRRNNSKGSMKDFLTGFPSNSKIQHKSDTECETTKTTPKITGTKTMRLKKTSAAGGDSQNYTNVLNPPQITNLLKQSQQARQEVENVHEVPIIANDKQGFLNVADLPLVALQNSTSEKSRNTLDMPLLSDLPITGTQNSTSTMSKQALCRQLFGSFSEESIQSVDSNMRDDNNNTELNSVQPYLPIEELPQIDQDKAGINEGTAFSASAKNKADQINAKALRTHQNQYKILQSVLPIENNPREPTNNLRSKVQSSTVDDVRVSNQGENVEEIAKPIDQNSVESNGISKTRNKRKSIPIKRSLKETPQKRRNNSKESRKDFLTGFPSNSKIQHKSDTECETTKTTPKITETKTMRLKKILASEGDSQNYTNVSNPPQITNLSKQSQQARQEMENVHEVPIIANDKQGFLNAVDLPLVALQNSTSEKSRNTLDMPLVSDLPITGTQNSTSTMSKQALCRQLFGSFSEESTQSVDSNMRDDNNNTELNSVRPYLPIEKLPQIDQDKAGINEGTAFSASAKNKADQINAEALKTHQNQYKILQSVLPIENNPREPTNNLRSKVQSSTVDDVRVSNQGENVEEIAKPIGRDYVESNGISKTRNKRKSISIKRSLKETPQKRRNNSKGSKKDFLTGFPSNSKIQHKSDTECETTKTTPKITETKTMRLKKISAAGGDSQNYTNVSNPPQITNLLKQSQQARQEMENVHEVPIIANDKQGFLTVVDLPLVALQNSKSEKSRNTLDMPLVSDLPITGTQNSISTMSKQALCKQLFGSFSEESTQNVDSNMRDDNNNTELNSVQPYLPIEELPQIDQDKAGINEGTAFSASAKNKADQINAEALKTHQNQYEILQSALPIENNFREPTNNLRSKVQSSTVDDVRVSNQGENVEEIAKPIGRDYVESNGISKTRNKRKSIPIKRSLKETPQKRRNNSKGSKKDFLTGFPSNSKIQHKSDTECETTKTTPKITETKTMRLKKTSAAGGDSQNYTNVLNPPQITNLLKQSHQARQEMENVHEVPIIANDKQGFLNVGLPLVALQNSTSEKSRNTLDMPLVSDLPITGTQNSISTMSKQALCRQLFGSFSEESIQSVDSNMRDDNNNTELNSVQPYLPIEELPQIDQDKAGINEGTAFFASAKNKADQINAEALKTHQNQYKILQSVLPIENNPREPTNNLRSKVQSSTVDDVRVSNQGENVEEIAKPIDQNSVESNGISKTRNKRKSIPIKRSLKETPQKRRNNSKRLRKDSLTGFPSNTKIPSKVSKRRSNESDKSNLRSGGVRKSTDGGNRLKLDKGKKLKVLSKNKRTQTKNTFKAPRRPRGRPLTKPVVNFVLTQTQKKDVYDVKMHALNKKYVQMYDLGPNPRPKFKIVAGNQPHIFKPADGKYPNTTWTKCVDSGRVALDSCGSTDVKSEKTVITSNQLLESDQKFEHSEIEKGRVVETIEKDLKKLFKIEAFNVEVPNSDTLSSEEGRNVDTFVDLYDDIEPHLFKNDTSPYSFSSNSSGRFSISKVFGSIADIEIDLKKKSQDNTCLETPNVDNSISCSLTDILQSVTDGPSSDQVDGVNISGSLNNYRQDMNKSYDDLMGKMEKSFDDLSTSITPITEGSSISCRLILQNLNGQIRQDEIKGAVNNIAKARNCTSINENSGGKRKTTTLPEYYKQTKAKSPLMPENLNGQTSQHDNRKTLSLPGNYKENEVKCVGNFTRDEKLAKIRQRKDNWIKTPKNSGDTVRNIELKPPASQKTASTAQDNLRSIRAPLSTRDHANSGDCKLISPPEKSGEFVFKSKVNMIPVATPSCPRPFVHSTKSIPKVLRERSTNISHTKFKKPKDLAGVPIHSNPNPLQNHYENPEDLLADLVEISKPINDKNDTDERAMVYYSWKQKLEEARTNAYPTSYQKLRKYCVIQLRRYIFPNMSTTQPPLPHSKV